MVRIRFQRVGRKNRPAFRIVVAEHKRAVKGKFIEVLGSYDPVKKDHKMDQSRIEYWVSCGAQPTPSVARFLKEKGIANMDKYIKHVTFGAPAKTEEAPASEAPAAEAPAEA